MEDRAVRLGGVVAVRLLEGVAVRRPAAVAVVMKSWLEAEL